MTACLCGLCSIHVEGNKEYWTVWLDGDCGAPGGGGLPLRGLGACVRRWGLGWWLNGGRRVKSGRMTWWGGRTVSASLLWLCGGQRWEEIFKPIWAPKAETKAVSLGSMIAITHTHTQCRGLWDRTIHSKDSGIYWASYLTSCAGKWGQKGLVDEDDVRTENHTGPGLLSPSLIIILSALHIYKIYVF